MVAVLALAVLAGAGSLIYRSWREVAQSAPRTVAEDEPTAGERAIDPDDPGMGSTHTRLLVIPGDATGGRRPVVALESPTTVLGIGPTREVNLGILARELVRQAVLIAARDELGLDTRDAMLGDAAPTGAGGEGLAIVTAFRSGSGRVGKVLLRRTEGTRVSTLVRERLPDPGAPGGMAGITTAAELLARTEFPDALRKVGLEGRPNPNPPRAGASLPEGVEAGIGHLGYVEPFAAVRDVHAALRTDGESPARLGALVRGYALLGLLAEHHWHPAHKVFKARALLYAQRLVVRESNRAFGLWHRAFAEAVAGLHQDALADLADARNRPGSEGGPKPPGWVDLIDAYVRGDTARSRSEGRSDAPLAALLRLAAVEYPILPGPILQAARDVLALEPDCDRASHDMCRVRGVANMQVAMAIGPEAIQQVLPGKLRALSSLPAGVQQHLDGPAGGTQPLVEALGRAGAAGADSGEPSWSVLGHLIREARFVQIYWRLVFLRDLLAVPADEFWTEVQREVAGHRFRPYLETFVQPPDRADRVMSRFLVQLDETSVDLNEMDMVRAFTRSENPKGRRIWGVVRYCIDDVADDLSRIISASDPADRVGFAGRLLAVSPNSTHARATLIEDDWEQARPHLADWEKGAQDSPALLAALARHYHQSKEVPQARKALTRYLELSPDAWAYEMYAETYKSQGDFARWREILDEFLAKGEDSGLDQARVRVQIANDYMGRRMWDKAWPYARAAAETWAGWAMECAQRCAEGLGNWKDAELWVHRQAQRYPNTSWAAWFLFCKRTGHGDTPAARAFAEEYLRAAGDRPDIVSPDSAGFFFWIAGAPKEALAAFRKAYEASPSPASCIHPLLVADQLGDAAARREFLDRLLSRHRRQAPRTVQVCELLFQPQLTEDRPEKAGAPDLPAVDRVLETMDAERRGNSEFVVGLFLKNRGNLAAARPYLERCTRAPGVPVWNRALAADALHP